MKNLKLKEIIWEVTNKCNKNCDYCGSLNIINNDYNIDHSLVEKILVNDIIEYGVEEVNLSGGEPGDMNVDMLQYIIDVLTENNIIVKIITNGAIIEKEKVNLSQVNGIGLSINNKEDIQNFDITLYPKLSKLMLLNKTTILTNFGTYNIWDFDEIFNIVKDKNLHWQIQLTIGGYQLNEKGIEYLYSKIESMNYKNYILADNLQKEHNCTAGMNSCGITYDGYVIPCLSMRSYDSDIKDYIIYDYDLKGNSLKDIWENQFKEIRFQGKFKSCRDCINYPKEEKSKLLETEEGIKDIIQPHNPIIPKPKIPKDTIIMMYGVHLNNDQIT